MSKDTPNDIIAPLELIGFLDGTCFESIQDFLTQLPNYLVAKIPASITNVIVGPFQPTDTQRDSIWFKTDNSGAFVGIYAFSSGTFTQVFPAIYKEYTPVITALPNMSVSYTSSSKGSYKKEGEEVVFMVESGIVLSGTATGEVYVSLPPFVRSFGTTFSCTLNDGTQKLGVTSMKDDSTIKIEHIDNVPFTIGPCGIAITGTYKTLQ